MRQKFVQGAAFIAIFAITASSVIWQHREQFLAGQNDFLMFYSLGAVCCGSELYSQSAAHSLHVRVAGAYSPAIKNVRLPFYAAALKPLASLPYGTAYVVWQGIQVLALIGVLFLLDDTRRLLLAAVSIPIATSFLNGQDSILLVLFIAIAIRALRANKDLPAGVVFSLCAIKFHIFLMLPVAFLISRRWSLLFGWCAGSTALMLVSFAIAGPSWPLSYAKVLQDPVINPRPWLMATVHGIAQTMGDGAIALEATLATLVIGLAVVGMYKANRIETAIGLALVAGILLARHAYIQDCVLLLIAGTLVYSAGMLEAASLPPLYFAMQMGPPWNVFLPLLLVVVLFMAVFRITPRRTTEHEAVQQ